MRSGLVCYVIEDTAGVLGQALQEIRAERTRSKHELHTEETETSPNAKGDPEENEASTEGYPARLDTKDHAASKRSFCRLQTLIISPRGLGVSNVVIVGWLL